MRTELAPRGFELLSVAMDLGGADAARPFVPDDVDFPVVVDSAHTLGELFGVINVPSGIWIDEGGVVVRPPETAYPARPTFADIDTDDPAVQARLGEGAIRRLRTVIPELGKMQLDPEAYVAALRDWVAHGSASRYALSPQEVIERSQPRDREQADYGEPADRPRDGSVRDHDLDGTHALLHERARAFEPGIHYLVL